MSKASDGDDQSSLTLDIDEFILINKFGAPSVSIEGTSSLSTPFDCGLSPLEVLASQEESRPFVINFVFEVASVRLSGVAGLQWAELCEPSPLKRHCVKRAPFGYHGNSQICSPGFILMSL